MVTLEEAKRMIKVSQKKAEELGVLVSVAVVDEKGTVVALEKMDGALIVSPRFAIAKAYTSASFGMPSGDIAAYAAEGKPYFGLNDAFGGEFMLIAGGEPIKKEGKVVGGIGIGGSTDIDQDSLCAKAAIE